MSPNSKRSRCRASISSSRRWILKEFTGATFGRGLVANRLQCSRKFLPDGTSYSAATSLFSVQPCSVFSTGVARPLPSKPQMPVRSFAVAI